MKILFDECVPKRLKRFLSIHTVVTVPEAGWAGVKNGELLKLAADKFEVFITVDRNLSFQQNPEKLTIPVIVIHSISNKLSDLEPFMSQVLTLLKKDLSETTYHIGP